MEASLRLIIKAKSVRNLVCSLYLRTVVKSFVEAISHSPSGIIFIKVFRWVNLSGPPCMYYVLCTMYYVLCYKTCLICLHELLKISAKLWSSNIWCIDFKTLLFYMDFALFETLCKLFVI